MATENGAAELGIQSSPTGAKLGQEAREELGKGCLTPGLGQFLSGSSLCGAWGTQKSEFSLGRTGLVKSLHDSSPEKLEKCEALMDGTKSRARSDGRPGPAEDREPSIQDPEIPAAHLYSPSRGPRGSGGQAFANLCLSGDLAQSWSLGSPAGERGEGGEGG